MMFCETSLRKGPVTPIASAPPSSNWTPDTSDALTAFESLSSGVERFLYIFDGASCQRTSVQAGGIASGLIGAARSWVDPTVDAAMATTVAGNDPENDPRPTLGTTASIVGAVFDGDRTSDLYNSRLTLPYLTAQRGIIGVVYYLNREDSGAAEAFIETPLFRGQAYWGAQGTTAPHARAGSTVLTSAGGSSPYQAWDIAWFKYDQNVPYLAVRRKDGEWVEASLNGGTPWIDGAKLLGRGSYSGTAGPPFLGTIRSVIYMGELPADDDEEQIVVDAALIGTAITDTAPEDGGEEPPPPGGGVGTPLTTALRTVNVSNRTQLLAALDVGEVQPGDHIVLANGTYSGDYTTEKAGADGAEIVIRAANPQMAVISGRIILNHNYYTTYQLSLPNINSYDGNVYVDADYCRVLRCKFDGAGRGVKLARTSPRYTEIAYNYFEDNLNAIQVLIATSGSVRQYTHIHHNHVKGGSRTQMEHGSNESHSDTPSASTIEYNFFEDNSSAGSYVLGLKSSEHIVRFNTIKNAGTTYCQQRHGRDCQWIANAFINSAGCLIRGVGHLVMGNYKSPGSPTGRFADIGPQAGSIRQAEFESRPVTGETDWPACDDSTFIGNLPLVRIGGGGSDSTYNNAGTLCKPRNIRVESAEGAWLIDREDGSYPSVRTTTESQTVPLYVVLTAADVGLEADL